MPSIRSISFDTAGLTFGREENDRRTWITHDHDSVSLHFFHKKPDLGSGLRSLKELNDFYRTLLNESPAKLVDVTTVSFGTCRVIRATIKVPQKPSGMTYVGSFTIPFRNFSFVAKVQCPERGTTGAREAILFDRQLGDGNAQIDLSGANRDWNPDSPEFDSEFPQHPLSRARRLLEQIQNSISIDPETLKEPGFPLP